MADRALTLKELQAEKIKLGRSTIFELEQKGKFPRRRRFGARVYWMESEIDQWLADNLRPETTEDVAA